MSLSVACFRHDGSVEASGCANVRRALIDGSVCTCGREDSAVAPILATPTVEAIPQGNRQWQLTAVPFPVRAPVLTTTTLHLHLRALHLRLLLRRHGQEAIEVSPGTNVFLATYILLEIHVFVEG